MFNSSHPRTPELPLSTPKQLACTAICAHIDTTTIDIRFLLMPEFQLAVPLSIYACVLYLTTAHSKCSQLLGMKCT